MNKHYFDDSPDEIDDAIWNMVGSRYANITSDGAKKALRKRRMKHEDGNDKPDWRREFKRDKTRLT